MLATNGAVNAKDAMSLPFLYLVWLIAGRIKLNARAEAAARAAELARGRAGGDGTYEVPAGGRGGHASISLGTGRETLEEALDKMRRFGATGGL